MHPDRAQESKPKFGRRARSVDISVTTSLLMTNYDNLNIEGENEKLLGDYDDNKETNENIHNERRKSFIFGTLNRRSCSRRGRKDDTVLYIHNDNDKTISGTVQDDTNLVDTTVVEKNLNDANGAETNLIDTTLIDTSLVDKSLADTSSSGERYNLVFTLLL